MIVRILIVYFGICYIQGHVRHDFTSLTPDAYGHGLVKVTSAESSPFNAPPTNRMSSLLHLLMCAGMLWISFQPISEYPECIIQYSPSLSHRPNESKLETPSSSSVNLFSHSSSTSGRPRLWLHRHKRQPDSRISQSETEWPIFEQTAPRAVSLSWQTAPTFCGVYAAQHFARRYPFKSTYGQVVVFARLCQVRCAIRCLGVQSIRGGRSGNHHL